MVRCPQLSGGCGVRTGGLREVMGSLGLGEVKGVSPGASGPDFTGVTVP
jgi:hypothetical protein